MQDDGVENDSDSLEDIDDDEALVQSGGLARAISFKRAIQVLECCQEYIEHAWKKGICRECRCTEAEHDLRQMTQDVSRTSIAERKRSDDQRNQSDEEPAVVGRARIDHSATADPEVEIRCRVLGEIVSTEETYLRGLKALTDLYIDPLTAMSRETPAVISPAEIISLFSNIQNITELNTTFFNDLMERMTECREKGARGVYDACVGDLFLSFTPYFKMYTEYCSNHEGANDLIATLSKRSTKIQEFLSSTQEDSLSNDTLTSYLILPIQRIPRYSLLLRELKKRTPEDHRDAEALNQALESVGSVALSVNEAVRQQENRAQIRKIQSQFVAESFIAPGRVFCRSGPLNKVGRRRTTKQSHFFLFNDMIIQAKKLISGKYKTRRKLMLDEAFDALDLPDEPKSKRINQFVLMSKEISFVVMAEDEKSKQEWLADITEVLDDQSKKRKTLSIRNTMDDPASPTSPVASPAPLWQQDSFDSMCSVCSEPFSVSKRRHHCRFCGKLVCAACSPIRIAALNFKTKQRACDGCAEQYGRGFGPKETLSSRAREEAEDDQVVVVHTATDMDTPKPKKKKKLGMGTEESTPLLDTGKQSKGCCVIL